MKSENNFNNHVMDYEYLLYSILLGLGAFFYFRIHKWWIKGRDENPIFFKPDTIVGKIKDWVIIILFALASLVFFFKAIA
ncbi:hypothetical protein MH928_03040 [Flavobacterium sp. WW92]|uniref:hypothetical protein n=1 Tax=unclassified Flavobacterium TaxID=196869 RepID=UPI0022241A31|nr:MULTISPECIES: hypothetical protein [unclassified Flavobacterium]WDO13685.1 hypothetical protein MH928_03040 [Flavobacterium sp. WW92]